jgi:hypothetical protein
VTADEVQRSDRRPSPSEEDGGRRPGPSGPNSVHKTVPGRATVPNAVRRCTGSGLLVLVNVNVPPMSATGERVSPKWLTRRISAVYRRCPRVLLRKEVIQPHLPVRLPCYDLVLITDPTFDSSSLAVRPLASGVTDFHDLTGGVYKARERIHRSVADLRLLATPTS